MDERIRINVRRHRTLKAVAVVRLKGLLSKDFSGQCEKVDENSIEIS